jgi:large-conductance mechanosensitive channel
MYKYYMDNLESPITSIRENLSDSIDNTILLVNTGVASSIVFTKNLLSNVIYEFYDFLSSRNILELGLAFIISTNINRLSNDFIDNIVSPVIKRLTGSEEDKLKDVKLDIFGINFEIGNFIMSVLKFIIMMMILYYLFKIIGRNPIKK